MKKIQLAVIAVLLVAALGACTQLSLGGAPMGARFEGAGSTTIASPGILVNSAGMTLYTFDRDVAGSGKSVCNGPCAANWPPLSAKATDAGTELNTGGHGDWSVIVRDDGSRQWAYRGKPIYHYAKDQKPGDRTGDGFNGVWHVVVR
jgi:predicted lipoprotein with Yx(FWY)xxD motif